MNNAPKQSGDLLVYILALVALILAVRANTKLNRIEKNAPALVEERK